MNKILQIASILAGEMVGSKRSADNVAAGKGGEFSVERIEYGWALRWFNDVTYHDTRDRALEAAQNLARARGDSAEDCGRIRAGVRW